MKYSLIINKRDLHYSKSAVKQMLMTDHWYSGLVVVVTAATTQDWQILNNDIYADYSEKFYKIYLFKLNNIYTFLHFVYFK